MGSNLILCVWWLPRCLDSDFVYPLATCSNGSKQRVRDHTHSAAVPVYSRWPRYSARDTDQTRAASPTSHFPKVPLYENLESTCISWCLTGHVEAPDFVPGEQVHEYLLAYAKHFDLEKHARLNTTVTAARWDTKSCQWRLLVASAEAPQAEWEIFDKVVFSMGSDQNPIWPDISGIEQFEGSIEHSVSCKKYVSGILVSPMPFLGTDG